MEFDEAKATYFYPCPCGDKFYITEVSLSSVYRVDRVLICPTLPLQDEIISGEEIARCPSCSLRIRVIYDPVSSLFLENGNDSMLLTYVILFQHYRRISRLKMIDSLKLVLG